MDILEKARAYDEVLEKAKKELHTCGSTDCDSARQIFRFFPELKESEDEKVRKEIIDYCHERLNTTYGALPNIETIKRWLAWLEKQGEKMKAKSEVIKNYTGEENVWNNACDFRPKHMQRCLCYDKYMGGVYCYVYDDISKYWCTQTTKEHDADGDNHICDYADYRVTVWMCLPKTTFYPEKQGEQKPILDFKANNWYVSKVDGKIHDLTYNPTDKVEQKPAWSEEDDKRLVNTTISFLNHYADKGYENAIECIDWLKSLKEKLKEE